MGKFLWQSFYEDLNLNLFNTGNQLLEAEASLDAAVMCAAFMGNVCFQDTGFRLLMLP